MEGDSENRPQIRPDGLIPQPHGGAIRPPWKKGECPPGAGRPKGSLSLTGKLRKALSEADEAEAEAILKTLLERAKSPADERDGVWLGAVRLVFDRMDGPVGKDESGAEDAGESSTSIYTDGAKPPEDE